MLPSEYVVSVDVTVPEADLAEDEELPDVELDDELLAELFDELLLELVLLDVELFEELPLPDEEVVSELPFELELPDEPDELLPDELPCLPGPLPLPPLGPCPEPLPGPPWPPDPLPDCPLCMFPASESSAVSSAWSAEPSSSA
jgi:hypothetical protein